MTLSRILILDTETDGTDEGSQCIEVACALYSVKHAAVEQSFASLMHATSNAAFKHNRIPVELLNAAPSRADAWGQAQTLAYFADAIVAYNVEFDRRFVPPSTTGSRPWICAMEDVQWPEAPSPIMKLTEVALAHGLAVIEAHRAMSDVTTLARLLTRCAELGHDIGSMLERGLRPKATFQALVSYDERQKAKDAGFRWEQGERRWVRRMALEDAAALPFPTRQIEPCL